MPPPPQGLAAMNQSHNRIASHHLPWWAPAVSGSVAGVAGCIVGHPLDTIKVELQQSVVVHSSRAGAGGSQRLFWATARAAAKAGLFRGLAPAVVVQLVISGVLFGAHSHTTNAVRSWFDAAGVAAPQPVVAAAAGLITGGLISPITCSGEALKVRAQASQPLLGMKNPARSLFAGWNATVLRCSLGNVAYFGSYAVLTSHIRDNDRSASPLVAAASVVGAGAASGVAFWTVAMPFDVVKTRQQLAAQSSRSTLPGVLELTGSIVKNEGVAALWRGYLPASLRAMPMNAALFAVLECSNLAILRLSAGGDEDAVRVEAL